MGKKTRHRKTSPAKTPDDRPKGIPITEETLPSRPSKPKGTYQGKRPRTREQRSAERYRLSPSGSYDRGGILTAFLRIVPPLLSTLTPRLKLVLVTDEDRQRWNEYRGRFDAGQTSALHDFIEAVGELAFTEQWVIDAIWHARRVALYGAPRERERACYFLDEIGPALTRIGSGPAPSSPDPEVLERAAQDHAAIYSGLKLTWPDVREYLREAASNHGLKPRVRNAILSELEDRAHLAPDEAEGALALLKRLERRDIALRITAERHGISERALKSFLASRRRKARKG